MKVAFFFPNKNISTINFSNIEEGNPGIGGSEFSALLIASNLCKLHQHDIMVFCEVESVFPVGLKWQECGDLIGAIKLVISQHIDFFIVDGKLLTKDILCKFYNVKFIAWANTFITDEYLDIFSKMNNVISVINVSKRQLESTKYHPIYRKSTYIYNAVPIKILSKYSSLLPNAKRAHNVCYIGSLHPAKGFQYLAKAWPAVIKEVPDAQLFVIGSGKLYGRNARLGKWGIASESFEKEFLPYIIENGKIIDSVHFLGILGSEKYEILSKCKVGVPNPSGVSETFGYTAVEMQFMGCQVTTIKCIGYLDTVFNKSNLYDSTENLSDYIVKLLRNDTNDYEETMKYIKNFSINEIISCWSSFLQSIDKDDIEARIVCKDIFFYEGLLLYYLKSIKSLAKSYIKKILKR